MQFETCLFNILFSWKIFQAPTYPKCVRACFGTKFDSIQMSWNTHKSQSQQKRKIFLGVYFSCGCIRKMFCAKQNNSISQLRYALQCRSKNLHTFTLSLSVSFCVWDSLDFCCVDLWPLKLIFLLVAGHCLVCVKQNNWAAAFRTESHTLRSSSFAVVWLMAGQRKGFFGWFKCLNGSTLASKLGFNILLNGFATVLKPPLRSKMWIYVWNAKSHWLPFSNVTTMFMLHTRAIKFCARPNVCLQIWFNTHTHRALFSLFFSHSAHIGSSILKFWWIYIRFEICLVSLIANILRQLHFCWAFFSALCIVSVFRAIRLWNGGRKTISNNKHKGSHR